MPDVPPAAAAHGRLALAVLLLACARAPAQQPGAGSLALIELLATTDLDCEFAAGAGPGPEAADAEPEADVTIPYRDIALSAGTAAGGDPAIGGEVRIIPSNLGLHFYQFDDSGELSLVTVAAVNDDSGRYRAVLSRHHTEGGGLVVSQLSGHCAAVATAE